MTRLDGRDGDELREVEFQPGIAPHADGSVLVSFGATRVICAAKIEEGVPEWMRRQNAPGGWLSAEYSLLPYATTTRKRRESAGNRPDGRTVEIQRLIGRALRAVTDLGALGARTAWVDCDVLQADGGTRTAAITGACVAFGLAARAMVERGLWPASPLRSLVAAVSVGLLEGCPLLDLTYAEDRDAAVDLNLVMTDTQRFVEIQGGGEEDTFSDDHLAAMLALGRAGLGRIFPLQRALLDPAPEAAS